MTKFYSFLIVSVLFQFYSFGQAEDESCLEPRRKVLKLIDKAKDATPREASKLFNEAIDKDDDNAMAYYEFAMYAYDRAMKLYDQNPNPKMGDKSLATAEKLFKQTLDRCSDYHANCFYYLGIINYTLGNKKEAVSYFKKFKNFQPTDINKLSPDREKRLKDVAEVITKFEENQSFLEDPVPFDPSIVKNVSTQRDEYFPMISPDNEIMFYTRRVDRSAKGDIVSTIREEFTWSKRENMQSLFDSGTPLQPPFNNGTFDSYGAATMSVDNKEMIICACKDEKIRGQTYRNCDLYVTYYERTGEGGNDYQWTKLENLGEGINTNDGWEGQPTLSSDGNTLYFTANRPDTRDNDIFLSERLSDGTWGPGKPFALINTAGKDKSPFFHQDSETFYFVSTVSEQRKGLGGTDIFYMRKQDDGSWSKPKNIGYPINTKEDELGLFVSTNGKEAFFSSRQKGIWNIYSFELYKEARPKSVVIVKGNLTDEEGKPAKDTELEITYEHSDKVEKVRVNGDDGKYAAVIKTDEKQDVMVNVKKEGHAFDSQIISTEELAAGETIRNKNMDVEKIEVDKPYTINDILYETASAALSKRSKFILKQFARFLKENESITILIQGHTDNEGRAQTNLDLSERRAQGVKSYLIELGIEKNRLSAKGYGQTQPKVPNTSAKNKAKNRRTDFVILKK